MTIGIEKQIIEVPVKIAVGQQLGMLSFAHQSRAIEQHDPVSRSQRLQATWQDDDQRPATDQLSKCFQARIFRQVFGCFRCSVCGAVGRDLDAFEYGTGYVSPARPIFWHHRDMERMARSSSPDSSIA